MIRGFVLFRYGCQTRQPIFYVNYSSSHCITYHFTSNFSIFNNLDVYIE